MVVEEEEEALSLVDCLAIGNRIDTPRGLTCIITRIIILF